MTGAGEIKWRRDFLHGAWKAAKRPAKPPNPAETGRLVSLSYQPGQSTGCRGGPPGGAGLQPSGSRGNGILGRCPRLGWGGPLGLGGLDLGRRLRDGGGSCRGSGQTSEDTRYTLAGGGDRLRGWPGPVPFGFALAIRNSPGGSSGSLCLTGGVISFRFNA